MLAGATIRVAGSGGSRVSFKGCLYQETVWIGGQVSMPLQIGGGPSLETWYK